MPRRDDLLKSDPHRTAGEDAGGAYAGAVYHLTELKREVAANLPPGESVNRFHWHLRAFFWELVAVRDSLRRSTEPAMRQAAEDMSATSWFREVDAYRNFAHQSFHIVGILRNPKGELAIQLQPAYPDTPMGDSIRQNLDRYLSETSAVLVSLDPVHRNELGKHGKQHLAY